MATAAARAAAGHARSPVRTDSLPSGPAKGPLLRVRQGTRLAPALPAPARQGPARPSAAPSLPRQALRGSPSTACFHAPARRPLLATAAAECAPRCCLPATTCAQWCRRPRCRRRLARSALRRSSSPGPRHPAAAMCRLSRSLPRPPHLLLHLALSPLRLALSLALLVWVASPRRHPRPVTVGRRRPRGGRPSGHPFRPPPRRLRRHRHPTRSSVGPLASGPPPRRP